MIAILARIVIAQFEPSLHDQLLATAQVVAADVAYARNLAVTNNSTYQITFEFDQDRYYLQHSGTNSGLDVLPESAFRAPADPPTRQTTDFASLPLTLAPIELLAAIQTEPLQSLTDVEFGPLGETTRPQDTVIWLASGSDRARRYISIGIDPITGLAAIGALTSNSPALPEDLEIALPDGGEGIPEGGTGILDGGDFGDGGMGF